MFEQSYQLTAHGFCKESWVRGNMTEKSADRKTETYVELENFGLRSYVPVCIECIGVYINQLHQESYWFANPAILFLGIGITLLTIRVFVTVVIISHGGCNST